jgi:PD-(D/E)XK nuclease superfamily
VGKIEIATIAATSPTLAEMMRLCALRSGLSRSQSVRLYVLGHPKAWLGIAYHSVLEKIAQSDVTNTSADLAAASLWEEAIKFQYKLAAAHPLDCRFGPPITWPGYYVARASVLLRAQEVVAQTKRPSTTTSASMSESSAIRERKFAAFNGKLVGRPDVILGKEIIDYKTGGITEYDGMQTEVAKASYVRQLRIYSYLVKETLGWWPERGLLLPMAGQGIEVPLSPEDCEREAQEAVALLDAYNLTIGSAMPRSSLPDPPRALATGAHISLFALPFGATPHPNGPAPSMKLP